MISMLSFAGGRASPRRRGSGTLGKLALVALALLALAQEGCQSGGCSSCGLRGRLFNRRATVAEPVLTDPGASISSGGTITESPGTLVPNGTSTVTEPEGGIKALPESPPANDSTKPGNASGSRSLKNGNSIGSAAPGRASDYETARNPKTKAGQPREDLARLVLSKPKKASASQPGNNVPTRTKEKPAADSPSDNPLDHLAPPADLPLEPIESSRDPKDPLPASAFDAPAPEPIVESTASHSVKAKQPESTNSSQDTRSALPLKSNLSDPSTKSSADEKKQAAASQTPGNPSPEELLKQISLSPPPAAAPVPHFSAVLPTLAGGGLPSNEGLDWLLEKGYKTLLDLREPSEVQPTFIAEVSKRGLRYLALPVTLESLDSERLERFQKEISQNDARPLYFFDNDGARAGALWFIRAMTQEKDKLDISHARREAQELGLNEAKLWSVAETTLRRLLPPIDATTAAPATKNRSSENDSQEPAQGSFRPGELPQGSKVADSGRTALNWRPYVAMLLTILGVPLAFWSRSGLSLRRILQASLPASAPRPKALPGRSVV